MMKEAALPHDCPVTADVMRLGWRPAEVVTMGRTTARPHHRSHDCCTLTLRLNNKAMDQEYQKHFYEQFF